MYDHLGDSSRIVSLASAAPICLCPAMLPKGHQIRRPLLSVPASTTTQAEVTSAEASQTSTGVSSFIGRIIKPEEIGKLVILSPCLPCAYAMESPQVQSGMIPPGMFCMYQQFLSQGLAIKKNISGTCEITKNNPFILTCTCISTSH